MFAASYGYAPGGRIVSSYNAFRLERRIALSYKNLLAIDIPRSTLGNGIALLYNGYRVSAKSQDIMGTC
jgi:hypothetical protein